MTRRALGTAAAMAVWVAGCGSAAEPPPAAEPAASPAATHPAGKVIRRAGEPEGVVADGRTGLLAVALRRPARLALLDMRTGRTVRVVALPEAARHIALARPGGPVLVPDERGNALVEVSLPGGRTRTVPVGRHPHDAVAGGGRIFVGNEFGDSVTVLDGSRVAATLRAPRQPGGLVATGGRVGVVAVRDRSLRLYDARTLRTLGTGHAGVGPTHVAAGPGGRLYVVDTQGDALLIFATRPTLRLLDRTTLPGTPYGIAADPRRRRVWITLTARDQVAWLRLREGARPHIVTRLPTVRQPNSVAVDPRTGRVWVAGRTPGRLQEIDPRSAR